LSFDLPELFGRLMLQSNNGQGIRKIRQQGVPAAFPLVKEKRE